jgi:glycosyltransferase involved in cell wall biosynthesis
VASKTTPQVSVLLPCYNAEPYIELCLRSLVTQSCDHIEILALDDGSTDATLSLLRRAAARDPRIRVITRENRGLVTTLNELIFEARGEFLARMDADDIAYPHRLARQVDELSADPELAMVCSDYDLVEFRNKAKHFDTHLVPDVAWPLAMHFHNAVSHPTVMYRAAIIRELSVWYDADYPHAEDFELFTRLSRSNKIKQMHEKLMGWRSSHNSVRRKHRDVARGTHARIVERELRQSGIDVPNGTFGALFADAEPDEQTLLSACAGLRNARHDTPLRERAPQVYDNAFEFFLNLVIAPRLTELIGYRRTIDLVHQAGVGAHLWRRYHYLSLLGQAGARRAYWFLEARGVLSSRISAFFYGFDAAERVPSHHEETDVRRC